MTFIASKLLWLIFSPANFLLILSCLGLLMLWIGRRNLGRALLSASTVSFLVVAVLPVHEWVSAPLENRFPTVMELPDHVDGIIVLGGAESARTTEFRRQPSVGGGAERLLEFVSLARRYPNARLVYTGGSGSLSPGGLGGADVARQIFDLIGFDTKRVLFESKSRNTYENAQKLAELVVPDDSQTWLLVTSAQHMPRAMGVFRKQGWAVVAYPVDYQTDSIGLRLDFDLSDKMSGLNVAMKEWVGLAAYYAMGRTTTIFPGPELETQ
jgi:uncharacterized SAM-binding protein YcdF (DUF218 family)